MLEILAPAGNMECADAAINNGANAIYLGLGSFSARQGAENFDALAFREIVKMARFFGVKVYVAMNTIVKNAEINDFLSSVVFAWNTGADAIILQDIFLGKLLKERYPLMNLHLSTQAGVCNVEGARLAKEYGFSRVILARETTLTEIKKIAEIIETEVFVQGALCTAFSGQCYFSSFAGGNSGNRGRCKQPCRKVYAYDRNGNTEKTYALSLSDLCVGEDVEKLVTAGVTSFKIEGRMRRAEYVAAAVKYYHGLLDNGQGKENELSDLKRTYNRGNYTKGLAFGQDKRFLSTAIQGHIGEKVGVVKVVNGKFLVESRFQPQKGDGFKILRDGKEIGGAFYLKTEGKCFVISSKIRLRNGDGVFVTTDTAVNTRLLSAEKRQKVILSLYFHEGEIPVAECNGIIVKGGTPLQTAKNQALTVEDIKSCFMKTDGLPVDVEFSTIDLQGNIFIPKSELNAFRRSLYTAFYESKTATYNAQYEYENVCLPKLEGKNGKTAVIANNFDNLTVDVAIYKADDYNASLSRSFIEGSFEKYLYYPAFATETDIQAIEKRLAQGNFDGIYAENYGGIAFAKAHRIKIFAGTGFNLINSLSIKGLLQEDCVAYYAISKEANQEEMAGLAGEKAFALSSGNIKIMELCYCPFGKTCSVCDKRSVYNLTDEGGRVFPVRRYLSAEGSCRFEVYNCASLIGVGAKNAGYLLDLTLVKEKGLAIEAKKDETAQKKLYDNPTSGHYKRGVL